MPAWVNLVVLVLSLGAAVLAWIAKIVWSSEYRKAKEAQIDALRSEVEALRNLTPMKLEEYVVATRRIYENKIHDLEDRLGCGLDAERTGTGHPGNYNQLRELETMMSAMKQSLETLQKIEQLMEKNKQRSGFTLTYPGMICSAIEEELSGNPICKHSEKDANDV